MKVVKDPSTRFSSLHRTIGIPKSALVMRKEMDFEKQTYSKWIRNKLRVVRKSKDNMKWQVRKQNKVEIHKCHNKFNMLMLSTTIC